MLDPVGRASRCCVETMLTGVPWPRFDVATLRVRDSRMVIRSEGHGALRRFIRESPTALGTRDVRRQAAARIAARFACDFTASRDHATAGDQVTSDTRNLRRNDEQEQRVPGKEQRRQIRIADSKKW